MMKSKTVITAVLCVVVAVWTADVQAAFVVEAHSSGLANANFSGTARETDYPSKAIGLTASGSVFGSTDPASHSYTYSYTPGVDVDNVPLSAGIDLGNGDLAMGLVGGSTGLYNVYITWPSATNVNLSGCRITVTSDGADIVLDPVDMNTGGSGNPGGNDAWLQIASGISLTSGVTYTVDQLANSTAYVSQRSHGVMWEVVPEPATLALMSLGVLCLCRRRHR